MTELTKNQKNLLAVCDDLDREYKNLCTQISCGKSENKNVSTAVAVSEAISLYDDLSDLILNKNFQVALAKSMSAEEKRKYNLVLLERLRNLKRLINSNKLEEFLA